VSAVSAPQVSLAHQQGASWEQVLSEATEEGALDLIDLDEADPEQIASRIDQVIASLRASLNISDGPLLRCALVRDGTDKALLIAVVHHLVFDGVSCLLFEADMRQLLRQLEAG
jgi:NRPS condensation-like uncharacterized protein